MNRPFAYVYFSTVAYQYAILGTSYSANNFLIRANGLLFAIIARLLSMVATGTVPRQLQLRSVNRKAL